MTTKTKTTRLMFSGIQAAVSGEQEEPTVANENKSYYNVGQTRTGVPVPGWKLATQTGRNASSNFSGNIQKLSATRGKYVVKAKNVLFPQDGHTWTISQGTFTAPSVQTSSGLPGISSITPADNMAKTRFVNEIRAGRTALQGGTFMGELRETLSMIRNPAKAWRGGINNYLGAAAKRRRGSKSSRLRTLSGLWLEYSFGWKPLIHDLDNAAKALAILQSTPDPFMMVKAAGYDRRQVINSITNQAVGVLGWGLKNLTYTDAIVKYYGVVDIAIPGKSVGLSTIGARMDEFVPTLWELMPYSFLVDYFTNVGDVLSCWSMGLEGIRFVTRSQVLLVQQNKETVKPYMINPAYNHSIERENPCKSESFYRSVTRGPAGSLVPSLEFTIPGFGTKWINLAALAAQRKRLTPY